MIIRILYDPEQCDLDSTYSDTNPASMQVGQSYPVTVKVNNTGSYPWSESALFRLGGFYQDTVSQAGAFGADRVYLPGGVTVQPGQNYTFSLYYDRSSHSWYL